MFAAVKQNTPNVSYVKGLDVWMIACIFFVFFVLLEYTILLKLKYLKPKESKKQRKMRHLFTHAKPEISSNGQIRQGMVEPTTGVFVPFIESPNQFQNGRKASGNGVSLDTHGNANALAVPESTSKAKVHPKDSLLRKKQREDISTRVEHWFSRIIPGLFVIFNLVYWPWLLISADYYNESEFNATNYAV